MATPVIVWIRRDLRLHDNPAMLQAYEDAGGRVVPVYIHAPEEEAPWSPGAASRWWLHHSLRSLKNDFSSEDSGLVILRGETLSMLMMLCERTGADAVYWNRLYDPGTRTRDERIKRALNTTGIRAQSFAGHLLREPWEILTGDDTPYKVFTPYSRSGFRLGNPDAPRGAIEPDRLQRHGFQGDSLESLDLLPEVRWDAGLEETWCVGEHAAWRRLEHFLDGPVERYENDRDLPGIDGVSRLSPHLHFGEISPRALWHSVFSNLAEKGREETAYPFLRQLQWRDFAHQLLFHFPQITEENFKPAFDSFPWRSDDDLLQAWQQGHTGIPLVDAGMRELWRTGFMHNRVRMNAASFLTKNAGLHWLIGARWFWDTLVDADLANNTMGWQWVAGSGPDAAPYFRVFNPVTQGQRFDPAGEYIRRWLPELARLPDRYIQSPWTAPDTVLRDAGVKPGENYRLPVLDLKQTRQRALADYNRRVRRS